MTTRIEGGCLCGAVRYRLGAAPTRVSDCHCLDCRRASGAPFVTWGEMQRHAVQVLSGEVRKVRHAERLRSFAGCCGTPLFFEDDEQSETVDVTIASLDHPESYAPEVTIWTEDHLPWVPLDPARKTFPEKAAEGPGSAETRGG
ncbi:MAG: GFA family protein [Spartobacteria bacterium]